MRSPYPFLHLPDCIGFKDGEGFDGVDHCARPTHRSLGSGYFVNAARSALFAGPDPDYEKHLVLIHVKANLGPIGEPLGYAIDQGKFRGTGDTSLSADQVRTPSGRRCDGMRFELCLGNPSQRGMDPLRVVIDL